MENFGTIFATPGIAEKGYLDVRVDVTSAGGHSSIPPKHTVRIFSFLLRDCLLTLPIEHWYARCLTS